MKILIAVSGSDGDDVNLTPHALKVAEKVGHYIAEHKAILLCGGRNGIMKAASKGVNNNNGLAIGILPHKKSEANDFVDIPIPTDMGNARDYLLINAADVVIGIGGRWGTLNEISYSMCIGKPTIVIKGTGGWADLLSDPKIVNGFVNKPHVAKSAKEAVEMAINLSKG